MATVPWNSSQDGQRITVNMMIKQPALVPARILQMLDQQFLTDAVLRQGPPAPGGAVIYRESTPLFADDQAVIVEEFGEIPAATGQFGIPRVARTAKRALGVIVSEEMRLRDDVDAVDTQITQVRNTIIRSWEDAFWNALLGSSSVHQLTATAAWSSGSSKIRFDLAQAEYLVSNSDADSTDNTGTNKFMFQPDTLIISNKTSSDFLASDDIAKVFIGGDIASENLQYRGVMPRQFFGLDVIKSWRVPANKAVVLQRKIVGGVSDERSLWTKPLYMWKPEAETWRSDVGRQSAVFIDQPKAACVISGV